LCCPTAALFGSAIAFVASNALSLVQAAIDAAHGRKTIQKLSFYYLALEIAPATDGLLVVLPSSRWAVLDSMAPEALARTLVQIARSMDLEYYAKSTRGPKKPKPKPKHLKRNVHVSTMELLAERENSPY
jgi:hypothetical protein